MIEGECRVEFRNEGEEMILRFYPVGSRNCLLEATMDSVTFGVLANNQGVAVGMGHYTLDETALTLEEEKTELVLIGRIYTREDEYREICRKALAPFEVDGWRAVAKDADDFRRLKDITDRGRVMEIRFTRSAPEESCSTTP